MALNIIELIKGQLGPALVSQTATQLGESESAVSKAISVLLPAVLGGMADHADQPVVMDSVKEPASVNMLGNLQSLMSSNENISTVLAAIFGNNMNTVVDTTASYSGIKESSAQSLLAMVTAAAMGSVSRHASDNNLDKTQVSEMLKEQKGMVTSLLPAGMSLVSLGMAGNTNTDDILSTGTGSITESPSYTTTNTNIPPAAEPVSSPITEPEPEVTRAGQTHVTGTPPAANDGGSIWKWLLPLILVLLAGYFLWKQCNDGTTTTAINEQVDSTATTDNTYADTMTTANERTMSDIDLNGKMLRGYEGGMESRIVEYLKSGAYQNASSDEELKNKWFEFDNVNFKMNEATELESGSMAQIENLAQILKAYPDAKIKIGGYADNTGGDAVNQELSDKRANFIKAELEKLGVGNQVTGTEGYSNEFAKEPASASDAERATDRDMAIRFTK
ncbi:OmpA family protein [Chryseobacterium salipaludis]|uniref:OmpA family protein n=1 Tax=Chryseobacterium TaxID=59732 RepID=UPI001FF56260|nr:MULTISPECIES: OmpA family protein [Chryseobacterium]MCJ8497885.1 OmpA family protein [Chryseobacterium salipaludis]MCX3296916.1 OmpA family protein [Planobacterium sp. JC490]